MSESRRARKDLSTKLIRASSQDAVRAFRASRRDATVGVRLWIWLIARLRDERGDVPGWVLIVLMTSALVVAIWTVARDRLVSIVETALDTVCGDVGC
jgi:hypothetical protein